MQASVENLMESNINWFIVSCLQETTESMADLSDLYTKAPATVLTRAF